MTKKKSDGKDSVRFRIEEEGNVIGYSSIWGN